MRNTVFFFLAMQTVTSSTNYAINQIKTAESPELPRLDISLRARVRNVSARSARRQPRRVYLP